MRKMITAMLVLSAVTSYAQDSGDDGTPVVYFNALDTNMAGAQALNSTMVKQLGGFGLAFTDTSAGHSALNVYNSNGAEGLRILCKYRYEDAEEGQAGPKRQVVNYIKISATERTMCQVFGYIFHTNLQPNQLLGASSNGTPAKYKDGRCMYMLSEAEFRPGYWELTLVK